MSLKLYNSLSRSLGESKPIKAGEVGMYNCGPTVYDHAHIGNLRSFFLADILRRTFEFLGFRVKQVMNITDVGIGGSNDEGEDKIIRGLKREGKTVSMESMKKLGDFYTERFKEDIARLNIKAPHVLPKASEHISDQIELIKILEGKGFTYKTSDGLYFDVSRDKHYGRLGSLSQEAESRVVNAEKRNARDFALWKFNSNLGFESPWGQGFPGWHLECSAMSIKYLGKTFDIHTGGLDLRPIHHNNEIAQSENAYDSEFARYWIHNEFINAADGKMAKSGGNYVTLNTLIERGFSPLAYRYFLLLSHYRTPTTFTWEALEAAENAYRKLKETFSSLDKIGGKEDKSYKEKFQTAVENDLNTPEALAAVWELVKDSSLSRADKRATLLGFDQVLGLDLEHNEFLEVPVHIVDLGEKRKIAKDGGDFEEADRIREEIKKMGYEIRDAGETFSIYKR